MFVNERVFSASAFSSRRWTTVPAPWQINLRNSPLTAETIFYLHGLSSLPTGPVWLFISFYWSAPWLLLSQAHCQSVQQDLFHMHLRSFAITHACACAILIIHNHPISPPSLSLFLSTHLIRPSYLLLQTCFDFSLKKSISSRIERTKIGARESKTFLNSPIPLSSLHSPLQPVWLDVGAKKLPNCFQKLPK